MAMASIWLPVSVSASSCLNSLDCCSNIPPLPTASPPRHLSTSSPQGLFALQIPPAVASTSTKSSQLLTRRRRRRRGGGRLRRTCCMSSELNSENVVESTSLDDDDLKLDPRKDLEERFAVLNTGRYECRSCGHIYDQAEGDPTYPIAAGLDFQKLPEDWRCPTCGAAKSYFKSISVEVAGFAQNQSFGFGTNSLTSGQKSILIYGSLVLAFILFLSGYFLQ